MAYSRSYVWSKIGLPYSSCNFDLCRLPSTHDSRRDNSDFKGATEIADCIGQEEGLMIVYLECMLKKREIFFVL